MRKLFLAVISFFLFISLCLNTGVVKADTQGIYRYDYLINSSLDEADAQLSLLSVSELQKVIDETIALTQSKDGGVIVHSQLGKVAWLAAAKMARAVGYPLSATLVEHSVRGTNYNEYEGQFARSIRNTDVYKDLIRVKSGNAEFNNGDLYYAIHGFKFNTNTYSNPHKLFIYDEFDFEFGAQTRSLFASVVNNFAAISQRYMDVLKPISVRISMDI